jgi:hypothetical protein
MKPMRMFMGWEGEDKALPPLWPLAILKWYYPLLTT